MRIAYQGEPGAFSEQAAREYSGGAATVGWPTFRQVFEQVASGGAQQGVIPVENSIMGSIPQNADLLMEHGLSIVGEITLRVSHCLIAHDGVRPADVRRVLAHPAAAAQCDRFLRAHPEWTVVPAYDTAGSVKMIREQGLLDAAAVASERAARVYAMQIVAEAIEDSPHNFTRFVVIAREQRVHARCTKTSVAYAARHEPGALCGTLRIFADRAINLTRIESRPVPGRPWEYVFHVDFEGHVDAPVVSEALALLRERTLRLRVLGCYPGA